jgi:hypothetical protein
MSKLENPFPSNGDAGKIPKFTDFFICLREDRKDGFNKIILPILERANGGELRGNHDILIVGQIGSGKTHLLKFLEKKLAGEKVRMVSGGSLEIPSYNNILPVYVRFDSGMIGSPELFGYFFVNYLLGYRGNDFGLLNSPTIKNEESELRKTIEQLYTRKTGQSINILRIIAVPEAVDLIYEACEEVLRIAKKKAVLFLFDELEGVILTAQKQKEESLAMVMDFLRQWSDSINSESPSQQALYTAYTMTAPAYNKVERSPESGALLSRVRSNIIEIPQFSEEELESLVGVALEHKNLDIKPFTKDAISYVYRTLMGQQRYSIEAFHNAYEIFLREQLEKIEPLDIIRSTSWLDPNEIVDNGNVTKFIVELGPRYSYIVQFCVDNITKSTFSVNSLMEYSRKRIASEVTKERILTDLTKFQPMYIEISEDGENFNVEQPFYNRILSQPKRVFGEGPEPFDPTRWVQSSSETTVSQIKKGEISNQDRIGRLTEALDGVLKHLFAQEGITHQKASNGWRLYITSKGPRGDQIKFLSKPIVNETINQAEILALFKETQADAIVLLHDFDNPKDEDKFKMKLDETSLPTPFPWVNRVFKDAYAEVQDKWSSKQLLEDLSNETLLSQICIKRPVGSGVKSFTSNYSAQVMINEKGLWYSITSMAQRLDPTYSNILESTLKYVIQDFFGPLRKEIIDKCSVQNKNISSLLCLDKKMDGFARILMSNPKSHDIIKNRQILQVRDLPPGTNNLTMNKLCESGLFSKIGADSWRSNSLNDAQQFNPWIRLILYNASNGVPGQEIVENMRKADLGPIGVALVECLSLHFAILRTLELMDEQDFPITVDSKSVLLQDLQRARSEIKELRRKEFAEDDNILNQYDKAIVKIEKESAKVKIESLTELQKDSKYKNLSLEIAEIRRQIEQEVAEKRRMSEEKHMKLDGLMSEAEKEYKNALKICEDLNFNKRDSPIVKAIMNSPALKEYVLSIPVVVTPPRGFETVQAEKKGLEQTYAGGFLSKFLSEYSVFESHLSESIVKARQVENNVRNVVDNYCRDIGKNYERLLKVQTDFLAGSKSEISNLTSDSQRSLMSKQYVDSLMHAGAAKDKLMSYIEAVIRKTRSVAAEKKGRLESDLKSQSSYLANSIAIAKKKASKSNLSKYLELEKATKDIAGKLELFENFAKPTNQDGSTDEVVTAILNLQSEITSLERKLEIEIGSLNANIVKANRAFLSEPFGKALDFISKHNLDSLNYSEFVRTVGSQTQSQEIIGELIALGLVNLSTRVR